MFLSVWYAISAEQTGHLFKVSVTRISLRELVLSVGYLLWNSFSHVFSVVFPLIVNSMWAGNMAAFVYAISLEENPGCI